MKGTANNIDMMIGTTNYSNLTNGQGILRLAPRMGQICCRFASQRGTKQSGFVTIQALAPQILNIKIRIIRLIRS